MEEAFAKSASSLAPLLILIAVVFGGLLLLALILKTYVRRNLNRPVTVQRGSVLELAAGDMLSVLGRTFAVGDVQALAGEVDGVWCALQADDGRARTLIGAGPDLAVQFPGHEPAEGQALDERLARDDGVYQRQGEAVQFGQGHRLALYRGPAGRWLALEEQAGQTTLWRGKEVPHEGLVVVQETESA